MSDQSLENMTIERLREIVKRKRIEEKLRSLNSETPTEQESMLADRGFTNLNPETQKEIKFLFLAEMNLENGLYYR